MPAPLAKSKLVLGGAPEAAAEASALMSLSSAVTALLDALLKASSLAATSFCNWSATRLPKRMYGAHMASRRLMGLRTRRSTLVSQSRPALSTNTPWRPSIRVAVPPAVKAAAMTPVFSSPLLFVRRHWL